MADTPDVEHDLRDANSLSLLYRDFARLYRDAGGSAEADALDARRLALGSSGTRRSRTIPSCCASSPTPARRRRRAARRGPDPSPLLSVFAFGFRLVLQNRLHFREGAPMTTRSIRHIATSAIALATVTLAGASPVAGAVIQVTTLQQKITSTGGCHCRKQSTRRTTTPASRSYSAATIRSSSRRSASLETGRLNRPAGRRVVSAQQHRR